MTETKNVITPVQALQEAINYFEYEAYDAAEVKDFNRRNINNVMAAKLKELKQTIKSEDTMHTAKKGIQMTTVERIEVLTGPLSSAEKSAIEAGQAYKLAVTGGKWKLELTRQKGLFKPPEGQLTLWDKIEKHTNATTKKGGISR